MSQEKKQSKTPIFTPPTGVPTFTPPPTPRHEGATCFHHTNEPAVAQCSRCGKYICKDCAEAYKVSGGEYAGKHLCYDCCEELVANNIAELTANKETIAKHYRLTRIGAIIGAILGLIFVIYAATSGSSEVTNPGEIIGAAIGYIVMFGLIGGSFLTAAKLYFSALGQSFKAFFTHFGDWAAMIWAMIGICIALTVGIFRCMWYTISKLWKYSKYLKDTEGFIESDTEALRQMREYMEYTQVRSDNRGVDLEALMAEGSALYDNSYAKVVRDKGEAAADEMLRQATTTITENGEIIRSFAA